MSFEARTVLRVPFPFTDRLAAMNRPALVPSEAVRFNASSGHAVLAMITSAENPPWPLDQPMHDLAAAGLPAPSVVRCKPFTLDLCLVPGAIARLAVADWQRVQGMLAERLGVARSQRR